MLIFKKLAGGVLVAFALVYFGVTALAGADTAASPWVSNPNLNLTKLVDVAAVPAAASNNLDCMFDTDNICSYGTGYGFADSQGQVKLAASNDYLPVYGYMDNRQHFLAIPGSQEVITYTNDPVYGAYLYFNYGFTSSIERRNTGGAPYYQMISGPDGKFADKSGHKLAADLTSLSFSQNGQWMVVSAPNIGTMRVNLQTFEVLPFGNGFDYSIGVSPRPVTTITNDGRYAVVASKDFSRFTLYDLSTCGVVPDTISGPVACQSRDLQSYLSGRLSGFSAPMGIRLVNDDSMTFYARYLAGAAPQISRFMLSTNPGPIHQQDYLALGDSYISGEGAFDYLPGTDTADSQCHVSAVSYPLLIGRDLGLDSYHSVACSGATTNDVLNSSPTYSGQIVDGANRSELEKKGEIQAILAGFQQGYIDQLDFVSQYQPQAITVSIGGNDIGFSARLQQCLGEGTCYNTYEDRLEFVQEVNNAFPKMADTYFKLKNAGPDDMRIYVVGYPQIAKAGGNCALNVHMNESELEFAQQAIDYLDTVIKAAAAKTGVYYVDTQNALDGHRLCEAKPGSVALNGITAGNDFPDWLGGPIGRESYHPNDFGHLLLENAVLAQTHNLSAPMPGANPADAPPVGSDLPILNIAHSGRAMSTTEYDPGLTPDLVYRGTAAAINIDGSQHALAPNANLKLEIHSTSLDLGSFTAGSSGNLSARVVIPSFVPAGYHTLHIYGTDINDQTVDIFKTIYVAATADDKDGNGTADSAQQCEGIGDSDIDADQDGIDDACDPGITESPAVISSKEISSFSESGAGSITVIPVVSKTTSLSAPTESIQLTTSRKVLAASTGKSKQKNTPAPGVTHSSGELRIPSFYFIDTAGGFLALATLAYIFKR